MADLQDPLDGYCGLSLFPRTFSSLPNPSLVPDSGDLTSVHYLQLSLPVQNPDKLIDQAKNILDNTTEISNIRMTSGDALIEKDEAVGDMAVQYPRGQRPGLQRKRARFSLLPSTSQPTVNLESTLDFNKGPEEYFMAFERRQNAQKEIAKQTGNTFTSSDQYNVFKVPRSERPGIPGRSKKAKYKHLYSDLPSQNTCKGDILSNSGLQQEISQPGLASQETEPDNVESQQLESTNVASEQIEPATVATEELEMSGSVAQAEKTVNQLIDELLADGYGDQDGHRAINLLEERLQIKPLHLEKLNLPEIEDVLKLDFKPSKVNRPKSRDILSEINNLLEGKSATPLKRNNMETLVPSFGSPTPPKSPLTSLSLLNKLVFQSTPRADPFSSICVDQSPRTDGSPVENIDECSDPVDWHKSICVPDKLKSPAAKEDDVPVEGRSSSEVATEDSTGSSEKNVNGNLTSLGYGSKIDTRKSGSELKDTDVGIGNEFMNENLNLEHVHVDHREDGHYDLEDTVDDVLPNAEASAEPNQSTDYFPVDTSKCNQNEIDPATVEDQSLDDRSAECVGITSDQTQDMDLEQTHPTSLELQTEKTMESPVRSMNANTRGKSHPRRERKNKNLSRRQSLAGCGLSWANGVRRSTRIRSRPLEYWRGERFLYGRIHQGLATVIGIKYESPGKEKGGPTMKVKSFVSEEHKYLVDQAALC